MNLSDLVMGAEEVAEDWGEATLMVEIPGIGVVPVRSATYDIEAGTATLKIETL